MPILTDTLIRNAKPRAAAFKLPREDGLFLLVNPNGSKWWRFAYSFVGREKQLSLGTYPDVPLKLARQRRDEARQLVAEGRDPSHERRASKTKAAVEAAQTFKVIANEWLRRKVDVLAPVTYAKARWMLETFAFPVLGPMPLATIQPPDVLRALRAVEAEGKFETMHRTKARISEVFRYAIATGRVASDPCRDLRGALKAKRPTRHHAALTEPQDVARLMRAIGGYRGAPETCAALRLAPLVFVRPGELRAAQWPQTGRRRLGATRCPKQKPTTSFRFPTRRFASCARSRH